MSLEPFLPVRELADSVGVPVTTADDWRATCRQPAAHRFGKHLEFAVSDIRTEVDAQRDAISGR